MLSKDLKSLTTRRRFDRYLQREHGGEAGLFVASLSSAINRCLQSDPGGANSLLREALRLARFIPQKLHPRLTAMDARVKHWQGDSRRALAKYRVAIAAMQKQRDYAMAAQTRQGLMDVYMYLGQHAEALKSGRQALRYFRRRGDSAKAARVLTNIGNVYHRLDQNRMALQYYEKAGIAFEKAGDIISRAVVDFNRANVLANLNKLNRAEELYCRAAAVYREKGLDLYAAKADYSLAYLHFLGGRYTEALIAFEKVLDEFVTLGDDRSAAVTRLDLAEINVSLNQYGTAMSLGENCLERFRESGHRYEQGKAAYFMAEALRRFGELESAGKYLKLAARLFEGENNLLWRGMVGLSRCQIKIAKGQFKHADELAGEAAKLFARSGDKRRTIDAEIVRCEARMQAPKANPGKGRRLLSSKNLGYQQYNLFNLLGTFHLSKHEYEKALKYFEKAIAVVEGMLSSLYPDEIGFFFALDKYDTYRHAVECLLKLNRPDESFARHSRALALLNRRRIPGSLLRKEVPQRFLETREELRASLKKLESGAPGGQARAVNAGSMMRRLEQKLWTNERKIRSFLYNPGPMSTAGRPRDYNDYLHPDEILINYFAAGRNVGAFVLGSSEMRYVACDITYQELNAMLRQIHFLMEKAIYGSSGAYGQESIIRHYLMHLYRKLVMPLDLKAESRPLLLLDDLYAQVPFAALDDGQGKLFGEKFEFSVLINPDDLRKRSGPNRFSPDRRSSVFTPVSDLPLAHYEGESICRRFGKAIHYNESDATSVNLKAELSRESSFVHIATHASRCSENPLFSRLLMSDGPFFPFDLFDCGIKAELVCLSGCQTAAPGIYYGNSFSIARAFYQGGARQVLASLWPVSDKISVIFMTEFYDQLKESGNVFVSYKKALETTRGVNNNPAFWSPFVLIGI